MANALSPETAFPTEQGNISADIRTSALCPRNAPRRPGSPPGRSLHRAAYIGMNAFAASAGQRVSHALPITGRTAPLTAASGRLVIIRGMRPVHAAAPPSGTFDGASPVRVKAVGLHGPLPPRLSRHRLALTPIDRGLCDLVSRRHVPPPPARRLRHAGHTVVLAGRASAGTSSLPPSQAAPCAAARHRGRAGAADASPFSTAAAPGQTGTSLTGSGMARLRRSGGGGSPPLDGRGMAPDRARLGRRGRSVRAAPSGHWVHRTGEGPRSSRPHPRRPVFPHGRQQHPLGRMRFGPGACLRERVGPRHARPKPACAWLRSCGAPFSPPGLPAPDNRTRGGGRRHRASGTPGSE